MSNERFGVRCSMFEDEREHIEHRTPNPEPLRYNPRTDLELLRKEQA